MSLQKRLLFIFGILATMAAHAQPALMQGSASVTPNEFNCYGKVGTYCYVRMPDERLANSEGPCYRVKVLSETESAVSQVNAQFCDSEK